MKEKFIYVCQQCGQQYSKWMGKCQECGEWNSVVEERSVGSSKKKASIITTSSQPQAISEIIAEDFPRIPSDLSELDNVLGGGLVPGSAILLGGEPGVGKSTILLQAADQYARLKQKVLYVSGEESASQIALRSQRLGVDTNNLLVVCETTLEKIIGHIDKVSPNLLIIDSIQTIYSEQLDSQPGSVGQLRECAYEIISIAKSRNLATFLVGHVTKEGAIAGPKVLEHMVDVVLYFEGTSSQSFRLLRSIKNRFGSTNEIGVFEIASKGLKQVTNPSELFLSERPDTVPGSVIVASVEGTRPILVEVQALVSGSALAMPRRTALGLDPNRVALLVAILEKRGGFRLFDQDVYVNLAGGLRVTETAIDLGVAAALISSYTGRAVPAGTVFFGEMGLGGEVRSIPKAGIRLKEAERIGLKRAFVPRKTAKEISDCKSLELIPIDHVQELADKL
ncbi:MAG: DNA repair protein RadA [Proteobacteria bacterium]|nr:DNA repair protein RadA [Pseudomonadota bacterium]